MFRCTRRWFQKRSSICFSVSSVIKALTMVLFIVISYAVVQVGFKTMKLFPAGDMPRSYVKDLKGPYDDTHYVAIGGVTPENIPEFRKAGCLGVGLDSSLMPKDKVASRDWESCAEYVQMLLQRAQNG